MARSKVSDTCDEELKYLKTVSGLIEMKDKNGGAPKTVFVTKAELAKSSPTSRSSSDSAKGRRSNFRPGANGS